MNNDDASPPAPLDDGGPAFPVMVDNRDVPYLKALQPGMTLRDYFAAAVIQGVFASGRSGGWDRDEERAERAYSQADAMLKARIK